MYPKVKVRVQREEADQYAYEKSSLQSLKAFEWLSPQHFSSSDDSPGPVARVPRSYAPKSPPPSFYASRELANKKNTVMEESPKKARATSAPRPRAVLSSPENDRIIGSRTQERKEEHSGLKNGGPNQNRRPQCKIFPKSSAAESFTPAQGHNKGSAEPKDDTRAKGGTEGVDSSMRTGPRKKIAPSSVHKLLGKLTWN
ncbi:uncharacterized protein LOC105171728 [Sesamum indicum]|uniref:Uncharacterized protein LOC105171728 n=1 Tax=Sesamum indicum TaxID=4182 RepID=A0A6I9TYB2_SESIN|nr:uncharacterized protein LOC105171728 [Sesamum indicum]